MESAEGRGGCLAYAALGPDGAPGSPPNAAAAVSHGLQRQDSARAREMALARLMGSGPADPSGDPMSYAALCDPTSEGIHLHLRAHRPSFVMVGALPTLEQLQRRHADTAPNAHANVDAGPTAQRRQEARTNLIRKLSRGREQGAGKGKQKDGPSPAPAVPLQPFESAEIIAPHLDRHLDRSGSSTSSSSRARTSGSTASTSIASTDSSPHILTGPSPGTFSQKATPTFAHASIPTHTDGVPVYPVPEYDSSPTTHHGGRVSTAPSIYRPYRHTMERDRDSALARLTAEDVWEFDNSSGAETESPRTGNAPNSPPSAPAVSPAMLSALVSERERQGSSQSTSSNGTVSVVSREVGLGLDAEQMMPSGTTWTGPEPGYRFPGPAPSHSLEHAALKGQGRATDVPISFSSLHSSVVRDSPDVPSAVVVRSESPTEGPSWRRPRSSSLSIHSKEKSSDIMHTLSSVPARRSSKTQFHQRGDSLKLSHRQVSPGADERDHLAARQDVLPSSIPASSKERILSKLETILLAAEEKGATSHSLDEPPRHILLYAPVLQVVNANTVKDRYLFLFNDILLIAKPLVEEDVHGQVIIPSLETRFLVKSVVEISRLKLTAMRDDDEEEADPTRRRNNPHLAAFVERFAQNPHRAVQSLVQKGGIASDPQVLATLLFRTPQLDRIQLGAFLSAREARPVLKAYVERFRFGGVRVEDALRSFLASVRLPNDSATVEDVLTVFANVWMAHNPSIAQDSAFAHNLVMSILELNDFLNSSSNIEGSGALGNLFGFANTAVSVDDFIAAFRSKDPSYRCTDETLTRIYTSIKREKLQQAADNSSTMGDFSVTFSPSRLPHRLTYQTTTSLITVSIPKPDPAFTLRLVGQDLRIEPATLSFATSRTQSFQLTALALGHKTLLFLRLGDNAMLYSGVPINRSISVERAFMRHTFQLAFINHLNVKRKYMFSMQGATTRDEWVTQLQRSIEGEKIAPSMPADRTGQAGRAVALQVLRDAVMVPEDLLPHGHLANRNKPITRPGTALTEQTGMVRVGVQRSNSTSRLYAAGLGKDEKELTTNSPSVNDSPNASRMGKARIPAPASPAQAHVRRGSRDEPAAADNIARQDRSGHEIITLSRQNSLLPSVLGLMHSLQDPSPFLSG